MLLESLLRETGCPRLAFVRTYLPVTRRNFYALALAPPKVPGGRHSDILIVCQPAIMRC